MTPEEGALKIMLYLDNCQKIDAQPRMSYVTDVIKNCNDIPLKIYDKKQFIPKQVCPDCNTTWEGFDTTDICLHCQNKDNNSIIMTSRQTCHICKETDEHVKHYTVNGYVHSSCCLSCDQNDNIPCARCNKMRKNYCEGICRECYRAIQTAMSTSLLYL